MQLTKLNLNDVVRSIKELSEKLHKIVAEKLKNLHLCS